LSTQVPAGVEQGLKHDSSIHCHELVSLPKSVLTDFIGTLSPDKLVMLNQAPRIALDLPDQEPAFCRVPSPPGNRSRRRCAAVGGEPLEVPVHRELLMDAVPGIRCKGLTKGREYYGFFAQLLP
jgi:hypothetical protein